MKRGDGNNFCRFGQNSKRCDGFTKKCEQCRNKTRHGFCCWRHKDQDQITEDDLSLACLKTLSFSEVTNSCPLSKIQFYFPNKPGIFLFTDKNNTVHYIGQAGTSSLLNEAIQARDKRGKGQFSTLAHYILVDNPIKSIALEKKLSQRFTPQENRSDRRKFSNLRW